MTECFICDFCGKEEKGRGYLKRHIDIKHRKFNCNVCDREYRQKANLMTHLKSHFEKFCCQYCGISVAKFENFQKHVFKEHEPFNKQLILSIQPKEEYQCRFCVRTFPTAVHRNGHQYNVHQQGRVAFKCLDCNVVFITKEELRSHSFDHYSGSLHFCTFTGCARFFKTKKQLRNHSLIHEPPKFQCEVSCHRYNRAIHERFDYFSAASKNSFKAQIFQNTRSVARER